LSQHRLTVLAGGDGEVDAIAVDFREGEEDHWPGVAAAGERGLTQGAHGDQVDDGEEGV